MSVVGFDIGNDSCVIAAVKQRGIDVLLNEESKRETPSLLSFTGKQRLFGPAASSSSTSSTTISQIKHLLIQSPNTPIKFRGNRLFTPTQLLAMLLSHLKSQAEKSLNTQVCDCVISIPCYFSDLHRRAYLDAAAIAGLKPLRLFHDNTATALSYGIYRNSTDAISTVVFVDIGHCDTQVSVVEFHPGKMHVLSHASDPALGGRDFDELLFDHFASLFKEQYGIDVRSNSRAGNRLRTACEKLKKVLSANAEAPISIECLMDEKDVKGFVKREDFEKMSSGLLEKVLVPCRKALEDAGVSLDRVHSVELVGSGSRIPAVVRALTGFFKRESSRTLNASECVARGCALQCAMLSPVFRVREYEVQDSLPYSIGFSSGEHPFSIQVQNILFHKGQSIPSAKMLTLRRSSTFHLEAFYADPSDIPPGASQKISSFKVGPCQASKSSGESKVKVRISLNLHGILTVESASLIEDETTTDQATRGLDQTIVDNIDGEISPDVQSDQKVYADNNGMLEQSGTGHMPSADEMHKERYLRRLDLSVSETVYGGMTKADLFEAQQLEKQLAYQDKLMEQAKDRKNALEAYIYEIRNKLFERYRSFASESEREGISKNLHEMEEWLYEDGDDETEGVYKGKLDELKKLVDPIENRFKDEEARAQATKELLNCIVDYRMAVKSLATYERDAIINTCNEAEQWLRETTQQQDSLPKNADPVLWSHDIKKMTEFLNTTCNNILGNKSFPRSEDAKGTNNSNTSEGMQTD